MIELVLDHTDLARVRFAHSAVRELVTSLLVLQDPSRRVMHGRWLAAVRPRLSGLRLELLTALAPVSGPYLPQFLLPTVGRPWPVLAEELDAIAASPAELVRSELSRPITAGCWWTQHHCFQRFDLAGSGILVQPSAFIWPRLMVECCGVAQPAVTYPARGVAELWTEPPANPADPLVALVGRTRATLLTVLDLPRTTTQLAGQLGLSPPAVSQHLKVLKDTGLVTGRRRGKLVLYQRTPAAGTLLKASRSNEEAS